MTTRPVREGDFHRRDPLHVGVGLMLWHSLPALQVRLPISMIVPPHAPTLASPAGLIAPSQIHLLPSH